MASPSDLPRSAADLRDALRNGSLTAREVTEHTLEAATATAGLGAFVSLTADIALEDADHKDATWRRLTAYERRDLPPLHGMPIAHKDLIDVAGAITTHGSAAVPHQVSRADAPGVARLREAGAISLGKTQVPEFGLTGYSENLIAPPARNPLDPERTSGGSSGGSATAVASGVLSIAPGSDGGGSVRIPALACGLVGLKPGLGAVATDVRHRGRDAFGGPQLTVSGPLAHDARDAALLFDAMVGTTAGDAQGIATPHPATGISKRSHHGPAETAVLRADELRGLRVGVATASPFEPVIPLVLSPDAQAAFSLAVKRLEERAHHLEDPRLTYGPRYPQVFTSGWTSSLSLLSLDDDAEERLAPLTRLFRERARSTSVAEHRANAQELAQIGEGLRRVWGAYDVVLTPGLTMAPPRIGAFLELDPDADYRLQCEWAPFTSMVNVSGLPAIAVPMLRLPNGLAMGVQLIGRAGSEHTLLQLAAQLMA